MMAPWGFFSRYAVVFFSSVSAPAWCNPSTFGQSLDPTATAPSLAT